MTTTERTEQSLAPLLAVALVGLAYTLQISSGTYQLVAFEGLVLTLLAALAMLGPRWSDVPTIVARTALLSVCAGGAVMVAYELTTTVPAIYLRLTDSDDYDAYQRLSGAAAVLVAASVVAPRRARGYLLAAMLFVFFSAGRWIFEHSPDPGIDVVLFQRAALRALEEGQNPYQLTFPDIYNNPELYGGMVHEGRTTFGYVYPPLMLWLTMPAHAVFGDFRYAMLYALAGSAVLMTFMRETRSGLVAASLLLFCPRTFFVLEQGWTEPLLIFLLCASVFCACRMPRATAAMLGLFLVTKQYLAFVAPLALRLMPRGATRRWRIAMIALALTVGAAVSLPLALRDFAAFKHDVFDVLMRMPFRHDALTLPSRWYDGEKNVQMSPWVTFGSAGLALAASWLRLPRTPSGFAAGVGVTLLVFVAMSKQGFCNYYYFVLGAFACAFAALRSAPSFERPSAPS